MQQALAQMDQYGAAACPSQLVAPVLHSVVQDAAVQALVLGSKGVGSNGDGTVQFLCGSDEHAQRLCSLLGSKFGMQGFSLCIPACRDSRSAPPTKQTDP